MRNAECGMRSAANAEVGTRNAEHPHGRRPTCSAFRLPRSAFSAGLLLVARAGAATAQALPPLPDTSGFGVHVLALARAPDGAVWVGTYGQGIYVLRPAAGTWEHIGKSADTTAHSISWDFVHAFGFVPLGAVWDGTVGNGWGPSTGRGKHRAHWGWAEARPAAK